MHKREISFDGWVLDLESGDLSRDGNRQCLQKLARYRFIGTIDPDPPSAAEPGPVVSVLPR